jgi:hypothetical protein
VFVAVLYNDPIHVSLECHKICSVYDVHKLSFGRGRMAMGPNHAAPHCVRLDLPKFMDTKLELERE